MESTEVLSTTAIEPSVITDTLRLQFGRVVELGRIAADLVWRVHRPEPRPAFEIRMHPDALLADNAQLRVWIETVEDHSRDRAPRAPRFYYISTTGVRIRCAS
jgi:hypothetical protein